MLASSQLDLCLGLDIHMEMVPAPPSPVPVPAPFPMPFVGMIEYSPGGLLLSVGIAGAMSAVFGTPPTGPVLVNGLESTKTGDEAVNKKTLPHTPIPPGIAWTPLPKPLKLKMKPGAEVVPDSPAAPPGDAVMVTGSKTVYFEGSNACTLGTLAMSCSDPVRLPSSMLLAIPKGLPVLVGGPPTFDWSTAAKAFFLRNKWTAGLLHQLASLLPPGRLRGLAHMLTCMLTGHPVDVATGRLLSRAPEFELRGPIPLMFERYYSSAWAERDSPLGFGWSHTFDESVWVERGKVVYKTGDGRELEFHAYHLHGRTMQAGQEVFYALDRLTLRCLGSGRWEIRSPDGLVREFSLLPGDNAISRLGRIRNRLGQWVAFEYDSSLLLSTVKTSEGRWLRFEHRERRLHRVAVPYPYGDAGGWYDQVSFSYSEHGDLIVAKDSARNQRTYLYENHLLVEETDRDGVTFYFEYDGRDSTASCVRTWGDDNHGCDRLLFREITYDRENRRTLVEDSLGHTTIYQMNIANAVISIIDPHGAKTTRRFDEHNWLILETNPLGATTLFEFDEHGNETKRVLPTGATFESAFNAQGQVVSMTDPFGVRWGWTYDAQSRLVSTYNTAGERIHIEHGKTYARKVTRSDGTSLTFEHDDFGQLTHVGFPDGTFEHRWYDRSGQLIKVRDTCGRATRVVYDLEGRVCELSYGGELVRSFEYTPGGDLTLDWRPSRVERYGYRNFHQLAWREENGERIELRYDAENRLLSVTNEEGDPYTYKRDACGRIEEETTFEGRRTTYVRDAVGNARMTFLPDKSARQVDYDVLSNASSVRYADGELEVFEYDVLGNVVSATNAAGTVRYDRDARRRIVAEHFGDDWVRSARDSLGQRIGIQSSRGLVQRFGRGPMGHVMALEAQTEDGAGGLGRTWQVAFARDAAGAEQARRMPGGIEARATRDGVGRLVSQAVTRGHDLIARTDYQWEGINTLVGRNDSGLGRTDFLHDARGRLAGARDPSGKTTWRAPGVTGNLFKREDRSDRRHAKGGVILEDSGTTYGYDARGNVVEKHAADGSTWKYAWNAAGTLASVETPDGTSIEFAYDALRRRVSKRSNAKTTRWLWDGNQPIHEWTGDDSPVGPGLTTWLFEPDGFAPLGKMEPDGTHLSIVTDHLGAPREMFDEAGQLAWKAQLDIYGVASVMKGDASDCPWRWPGQYEDRETGLFFNLFRYYDPDRGNYISQDPIKMHGCEPGSSLYSYTPDPLAWSDPLGLAGGPHPVTGVWITSGGNPVFDSVFNARIPPGLRGPDVSDYRQMTNATAQLQAAIESGKVNPKDFSPDQLAAIAAGNQRVPGYTWHHNENGTQLQLVDREIHAKTGHEGGRAKKDGGRC